MERGFSLRHGENQPALAGINGSKFEYIAEKNPISFWILGVENDMCAIDH